MTSFNYHSLPVTHISAQGTLANPLLAPCNQQSTTNGGGLPVEDLGSNCCGRLKYYTSEIVVLGYPESDTLNPYHQILWPKRSSTQKCFRSKKWQITGLAIYTSRFEEDTFSNQHFMHSLYPHHIISMSKFQCMMARSGLSFHGALGVMSPLRGAETTH